MSTPKITQRKQISENPNDPSTKTFWVETRFNKYKPDVFQLQINEPYFNNNSGDLAYGRNNIVVSIQQVPELVKALAETYYEATGERVFKAE
ncbi:MAG TPA: hypothetical protein VFF49_06645 [Thermodesulfobacteriota bacterium]|nr:hypothetical protein [Thermodesulfobacteriota bacterium]